jgi:hypothetical protein
MQVVTQVDESEMTRIASCLAQKKGKAKVAVQVLVVRLTKTAMSMKRKKKKCLTHLSCARQAFHLTTTKVARRRHFVRRNANERENDQQGLLAVDERMVAGKEEKIAYRRKNIEPSVFSNDAMNNKQTYPKVIDLHTRTGHCR